MTNTRPPFFRSLLFLAGLTTFLSIAGCRSDSRPPPLEQSGGTRGTDPARNGGRGGSAGGGQGGALGSADGAVTSPVDATNADVPGSAADAPISMPPVDAEAPDFGASDVMVTCDPICDATEVCTNGQCTSICMPGETKCAAVCADLQTDGSNCGACGKACPAGQFCSAGKCAVACKDGETRCGTSCVTLNTNYNNCGACGKTCSGAEACVNQVCTCSQPNRVCGGTCTVVRNNPRNCGTCGNVCQGQFVCNGTTCGCPGGRIVCPNMANRCVANLNECCPSGNIWCGGNGGRCVAPANDRNNCGACGTVCGGQLVCNGGKCGCPAGQKSCGGTVCVPMADCCAGQKKCGDGRCIATAACCETCGTGSACTNGTCVGTCVDATCGTCKKCNPEKTACVTNEGGACGSPQNGTCTGTTCGCKATEEICGGKCITKCEAPAVCNAGSCKVPNLCEGKPACGDCKECVPATGMCANKAGMCGPGNLGTCTEGVCVPPVSPPVLPPVLPPTPATQTAP
jgi:hypothetical protein